MRVTKANVRRACAVCERTLLQGEYAVRFSPDGVEFVDVCPLCQDVALDYGWVREGGPMSPALSSSGDAGSARAGRRSSASRNGDQRAVVPEPVLRRLSDSRGRARRGRGSLQRQPLPRTVEGVARALGAPLVSIVPLSGVNSELVLTFAWEITWYQYRVLPEAGAADPPRRPGRGHLARSRPRSPSWNAQLDENGRVIPNVAR